MSTSEGDRGEMVDIAVYSSYGVILHGFWSIFYFWPLYTLFVFRFSFAKNCFLRAGKKGIAIRLPQFYVFSYRLREQFIPWEEVNTIKLYLYYSGPFPVYRHVQIIGRTPTRHPALFFHVSSDVMRSIPKYFFKEPVEVIGNRLLKVGFGEQSNLTR